MSRTLQEAAPPSLSWIIAQARRELSALTGLPLGSTLQAEPTETGWRVVVDLIERRSIPDSMDLLGAYEAHLSAAGTVLDFSRKRLHRRCDVEPDEEAS